MAEFTVDTIKTGKGLLGSRIAVVFAPKDVPPGSLVALTEFLNQQEHLRAIPGYHGPNKDHVLRVSGLKDDAHFLKLLQEDFPAWCQKNANYKQSVAIKPDIELLSLDETEHFPHASTIRKYVKENANSITGGLYSIGNLGVGMSAYADAINNPGMKRDYLKMFCALSYTVGGALLLAIGRQTDKPRDVYSLMEEVYPTLQHASDEQKQEVTNIIDRTITFVKNHPWEMSSGLFATGATAHMIGSNQRRLQKQVGARYEMVSALGTMTAAAIAIFVPEKEGRDLIDLSSVYQRDDSESIAHTLEELRQMEPRKNATEGLFKTFANWVQEKPLAVSAGISSIANAGYLASGMRKSPTDYGLTLMGAGYLAGNVTQTQATKGRGPGFDDVVTAASHVLMSDPLFAEMNAGEREVHIKRFAERLSSENEIVHKPHRMVRGISERLERFKRNREDESSVLDGFIASERKVLAESPFVRPRHVNRVLANAPTDETSQSVMM